MSVPQPQALASVQTETQAAAPTAYLEPTTPEQAFEAAEMSLTQAIPPRRAQEEKRSEHSGEEQEDELQQEEKDKPGLAKLEIQPQRRQALETQAHTDLQVTQWSLVTNLTKILNHYTRLMSPSNNARKVPRLPSKCE